MGFMPSQVDQMSMWEYAVCVQGVNRANSDGKPKPPTDEEFDAAIVEWQSVYGSVH